MSVSVKKKIRVRIRSGASLSSLILTLIFCVTQSGILSNLSSEFFTNEVRDGLAKLYHVFRYLKG